MQVPVSRILIGAVFVAVVVLALLPVLAPRPPTVDTHKITRGSMQVSVSEEGRTRIKDLYTVSATVAGRMRRVELDVGDPVVAGKTVLTRIEAPQVRFQDLREETEMRARVSSAEAQRDLAAADLQRVEAEVAFAEAELKRHQELISKGVVTGRALELAQMEARAKRAALAVAKNNLNAKTADLAVAKAALIAPTTAGQKAGAGNASAAEPPTTPVLAPVSGVLLRKLKESEATVAPNEPLFDVGDPSRLEVLVEMRSDDAAKVAVGAPATFTGWGGDQGLRGVVQRVEPFGFTKISALGIEEQRVNVILEFTDPAAAWRQIGHGYRVDVSIQIWEAPNVLKLPIGAMFRKRDRWSVYAIDPGGAVSLQPVEIGHINSFEAEVTGGLREGSAVILHPSDRIEEGMRVAPPDGGPPGKGVSRGG
ncbi:MAG: HlyD family efflux transporter periplasmic adaptor subunit [Candidatus Competibacter denitrificans]|jgi:HlyD family secretion protein